MRKTFNGGVKLDPRRCGDSATIIHYYPEDKEKNKWFSIDLLRTTKLKRKGDSFVTRETEKRDFATIAFKWHSKQKPKDVHSVWECGIFIFLSSRLVQPPHTILQK